MRRRALIMILALAPAFAAASDKNAGTAGAQFLKIGAGARPTSMGDAFVAVADDVNAVYYNPAGLGLLKRPEITAMHTQYFQGLDYDYGAYVHPFTKSALAVSAATLTTGNIERRGTDESLQGSFENQDAAYALSYARAISDRTALGLSARWITSEIDSASAQTWSGDLGVLHRFESPFSVGFAVRNLGGELKFNDEGDPLPLIIDGGGAVRLLAERLTLSLDAKHVRDRGFEFGLGSEWKQSINEKLRYAVRAGYNSSNTDADGANGLSIGAGIGYKVVNVDFAWIPFGDLGNTFRYAAHVKF